MSTRPHFEPGNLLQRKTAPAGHEPSDAPAEHAATQPDTDVGGQEITTRLEMVRFLAEQLNQYEPRVAVKSDMVDYLMSYFHESKKVIMFDAPPFESGYLFDLISWGDDAAAHHCGLPLLKFLSQMNDTVARAGGVMDFKISWLVRIMMHFLDDPNGELFEYRYRRGRLRIKTMPAGLTRFGVCVDVRLGSTGSVSDDYEDLIRLC